MMSDEEFEKKMARIPREKITVISLNFFLKGLRPSTKSLRKADEAD